ncbi:MAG TPA: hypothetical protein VN633_21960 [Bryobacteraceae bacterium]|nr:hypothetical protein [Bryobacteraceae bacterium]
MALGAVDFIFLGGAIIGALVLVLISNPLTSWVSWLLGKDKEQ